MKLFPILVVAITVAWSGVGTAGVRERALVQISEQVIVANASAFAEQAAELSAAVDAWSGDPGDARHQLAMTEWREARAAWKRFEVADFGPTLSLRIRAKVDFPTTRIPNLARNLAAKVELDEVHFEQRMGAAEKGFSALEILLFSVPAGGVPELAGHPERARKLASLIAADIAKQARANHEAWQKFAPEFAQYGQHGISQLVTQLSVHVDALLNGPFVQWGKAAAGTPHVELTGLRSGTVADDIDAMLKGLEDILNGGNGTGLDDAVAEVGTPAARNVADALQAIRVGLARVKEAPPDQQAAKIAEAREECRIALRLVRTELLSALGATLFFQANDGD